MTCKGSDCCRVFLCRHTKPYPTCGLVSWRLWEGNRPAGLRRTFDDVRSGAGGLLLIGNAGHFAPASQSTLAKRT